MNKIQKVGLTTVAAFAGIGQTFAIDVGTNKVNPGLIGNQGNADVVIQNIVSTLMTFLGLLAVLLIIYGGFLILTDGGDGAKVKKGKQIMFQAALGLFVIFIAYSAVSWLVGILFGSK